MERPRHLDLQGELRAWVFDPVWRGERACKPWGANLDTISVGREIERLNLQCWRVAWKEIHASVFVRCCVRSGFWHSVLFGVLFGSWNCSPCCVRSFVVERRVLFQGQKAEQNTPVREQCSEPVLHMGSLWSIYGRYEGRRFRFSRLRISILSRNRL